MIIVNERMVGCRQMAGNRDEFVMRMKEELRQIDLELTDRQIDQFYQYYESLIHWNTMINLTAITEMGEVVTKHFVDSLTLKRAVGDIERIPYSLIDVGTGAGFPGIPLKIAFPDLEITLLDSLNKRVKFLEELILSLELKGIKAVHGRAEDYARENVSRETFDLCVSRAVANISTLAEYCLPFVKTGGYFVAYKSGKIEEELKAGKGAIKKLSGEIDDVLSFRLPNSDERSLVKIKKIANINKKYPRRSGLPSREPLR